MDFSQLSKIELDAITREELQDLSEEDFFYYHKQSTEAGNEYMVNGLMYGYQEDDPDGWVDGGPAKALRKDADGDWRITQVFVIPTFSRYPLMVDEETFIERMRERGVSDDVLEEFRNFEPDFNGE